MARRHYRRRHPFKLRLKKTTIYTLFSIFSIGASAVLFASYTKSNEILFDINLYLTSYFDWLSFLVPINVILFGLLLTRIRSPFTRANVFFGFALMSVALIGFFQAGLIGQRTLEVTNSIFGSALSIIFFIAAILVGLVVFLNLTLSQVFEVVTSSIKGTFLVGKKLAPLFKSKKQPGVSDMQQITIKGLKEPIREELPK